MIKRYGNKLAVDNLSLSINKGEIIGLLGPNGAGKTTFINSIIGITKIQSGEVMIFGRDIKKDPNYIKKRIGLVPQNLALYNDMTAIENVSFFATIYGLKGSELKKRVQDALLFTNLWHRRSEYPGEYSGGMKRRLNIACSIVHKPELLFLDEPTVGIDPQSRNHILESVRKLNESGVTIIYTSHYMEEVESLCQKVVIMDNGRLIAEGSKDELKNFVQKDSIVKITVSNPYYSFVEEVSKISGVKEVDIQGSILRVIMDSNMTISKLINTIDEMGTSISKITMEEVTLEDVFLALTGKILRD
ncbi:MAG: ATP-binding cassette domain-containing protein [Halanaerobiales bacterium]